MVGTNLKAETTSLMDERDATESEISAIIHRLCQDGGPGLSANLVDSEGFPRADINIPAVRADSQRLAELRIDHINLTEKISQNIQLLHATKLGPKVSTTMDSDDVDMSNTVGPANADTTSGIPFAMVDEIAEASPAAEDGLQLGDQMVKFGSVESGDDLLPRLASEVQKNQGTATSVVFMRQGVLTSLYITPRTWEGSGLLGCHFKFL